MFLPSWVVGGGALLDNEPIFTGNADASVLVPAREQLNLTAIPLESTAPAPDAVPGAESQDSGSPICPQSVDAMSWNPEQHYQSSNVAGEYDAIRFSSLAGRVFNALERRTITKCFRDIPKDGVIADMPCGTGRLAEPILAEGYRVHGMDISREMLDVALQRLQGYGARFTCEVADARHVDGHTSMYDAALCARVLMHFPLEQQVDFLAGVARLSRSIVVINHSLDSPYQRLRRGIKRLLRHQSPANFPVTNHDIKRLLEGAGLREVRRYRLSRLVSEAVYIVAARI